MTLNNKFSLISTLTVLFLLFGCMSEDGDSIKTDPEVGISEEAIPEEATPEKGVEKAESKSPDKIFYNGRIYTFDWPQPTKMGVPDSNAPFKNNWEPDASAIGVKDGFISLVGSDEALLSSRGQNTQLVDLKGATLVPGLHDTHVHIAELGQVLTQINLIDVDTPEEAIDVLKTYQKKYSVKKGDWLVGQGWDEGAWANRYPDRMMLDKVFPENPVYLKSLHGFAVWVNSRALEQLGIDKHTVNPNGGEILRLPDGRPSGILVNRATRLVLDKVPEASDEQFENWVKIGMQQMIKDGYVAIHQAGADQRHIKAFQSLKAKEELPLRVYAMLSARHKALSEAWVENGPLIDETGWLDVRAVKAYYDGALGSRGARLLADYHDKPGHRGVSGEGYGFDEQLVEQLIKRGFQVGIHAIGDAGNRETLDFFEKIMTKEKSTRNLRHRIEHAQVISPADIDRLNNLQLIASMQPAHAVEDKKWAEERLGVERVKGAYAWRSLKQAGTAMTLNSDLPGSDHSIFYGLHSAVTRTDKQGEPKGGWYPEQALSIEEAVRGFTLDAAFSAFREKQTGSIAKGKWADFTVIDIDIMQAGHSKPSELLKGNVVMTVVNGEIAFQSPEFF